MHYELPRDADRLTHATAGDTLTFAWIRAERKDFMGILLRFFGIRRSECGLRQFRIARRLVGGHIVVD
jgi:hypothetical protein